MKRNTKGQSLELFFIDGKPDGMLTAQVFNWTGHVLMAPRTQISEALTRVESEFTGVYILIGEREGNPLAYVGEGDNISNRLRDHDSKRDWWNTAVLITTAANNLNKAHVRYLEARLVEEVNQIGKMDLENGTNPAKPSLSEADEANMEAFLEKLLMVLPAIRVDFLLRHTRPEKAPNDQSLTVETFELSTPKHGIRAVAKLEDGDFVVQAGSSARSEWAGRGSAETSYGQLHAELVKTGILEKSGKLRTFKENYAFKSPSAAAAVVNGRPANGTIEWKVTGTSTTYKQWEAERLSEA